MPRFAILVAMLIILGAGTAYAGDTVLYAPMLSAPTGGFLSCSATNVGKKSIPNISIYIQGSGGGGQIGTCSDVSPASNIDANATCDTGFGGTAWCVIKITGASHRAVRAVLNVVDSSGATILSVPATK